MKLIVTILSFYIFMLTALPCAHSAAVQSVCKIEKAKGNSDHHGSESGIDHCSPFCTCNCCATQVVTTESIMQSTFVKYCQHNYPEYVTTFTTLFFATIWQPPQLV
ncbi:MAG: hypothetical protein M0Q53_09980 [Prolixibacteraceae bacterium]|nr:hypothetical protein [Prolixibacteraceae bacterium]